MEANIITQVLLPGALFIIMMGMGLALVPDDFLRVARYPRAVLLGTLAKVVLMPLLTFGLLLVVPMQPELAVGFMLLAACPGGATTNLITNLAKGDVALSITLTGISSIITVFTIPFVVGYSLEHFMAETQRIELPVLKTIGQIFAITVLPVAVGMTINRFRPHLSKKAERPVKIVSAVLLFVIISAALLKERALLGEYFRTAGPLSLLLNVSGLALGFGLIYLFGRNFRQALTTGIETGVVNGTLGIAIAAGILQNSAMTIPSAIYSLIMFMTAGFVIWWGVRRGGG